MDGKRLVCEWNGCDREVEYIAGYARKLCSMHRGRKERGADMDLPYKYNEEVFGEICSWRGCEKESEVVDGRFQRFCRMHRGRREHGIDMDLPPNFHRIVGVRICEWEGCERVSELRNGKYRPLCSMHRGRKERGVDMDLPINYHLRDPDRKCAWEGCDRKAAKNGGRFCPGHKSRWQRFMDMDAPFAPTRMPRDIGDTYVDENGYVHVKTGESQDGWELLHRKKMADHIGRKLFSEETVHHKNGERADNDQDNLELWSSRHPPGQRVIDKLQWAREIIALYEPLESAGLI